MWLFVCYFVWFVSLKGEITLFDYDMDDMGCFPRSFSQIFTSCLLLNALSNAQVLSGREVLGLCESADLQLHLKL